MRKKPWFGVGWKTRPRAERLLMLAGVPSRYARRTETKDIPFVTFSFPDPKGGADDRIRLPATKQRRSYERFCNKQEELANGYTIGVGCKGTEVNGMLTVSMLVRRPILNSEDAVNHIVSFVDSADCPSRSEVDSEGVPIGSIWWNNLRATPIVVIHNVLFDAPMGRVQQVRDILSLCRESTRIVIVSGGNPLDFFVDRLRFPIDVCWYME